MVQNPGFSHFVVHMDQVELNIWNYTEYRGTWMQWLLRFGCQRSTYWRKASPHENFWLRAWQSCSTASHSFKWSILSCPKGAACYQVVSLTSASSSMQREDLSEYFALFVVSIAFLYKLLWTYTEDWAFPVDWMIKWLVSSCCTSGNAHTNQILLLEMT